MKIKNINDELSVSDQITVDDIDTLANLGVEIIICNRPDGEAQNQPTFDEIADAANERGMKALNIDFKPGELTQAKKSAFADAISTNKKVHAYCRTGSRSESIYKAVVNDQVNKSIHAGGNKFNVVIVGAGSAGIATAASLRKRNKKLSIAIIEPSEDHYYQPGWTMVGGGVFKAKSTHRRTHDLLPNGICWIKNAVKKFTPIDNSVELADGALIFYEQLVVTPGLKLDWASIEGLEKTLGKNGVTSNYRYDLAPYTWELVQKMERGKAIFTQPPMPIKCAGAPQKALYLSASEWFRQGKINDIDIDFYNAGGVLFGVEEYVPALMSYIHKYGANLKLSQNLIKVDGPSKTAWFESINAAGLEEIIETTFDLLHVSPPQCAPEFIRGSDLADSSGWLDVDPGTLQHKRYSNIWGGGDIVNTSNAKTMAAARKQAPVIAQNIANEFTNKGEQVAYDGYGSCPLTVEHGKVVLAEFVYGGSLAPSFPTWVNNGTKPTSIAWMLKANILPSIYWNGMLKGREWMVTPK